MNENNKSAVIESRIEAPTISLPKGGGAIRGIGEKFSANPVTGTGAISVPIYTTPGRSDFYPKLSLSYDSGAGNGVFGLGWDLSVPCITRKTEKGLPRYRDAEFSDTFILSGAEDLTPALKKDLSGWERDVDYQGDYTIEKYRTRIEGLFARIERWQNNDTGDIHWRSISPDNVTSIYGKSSAARVYDLEDPSRVFKWLLEESYDQMGNIIVYEYKQENWDKVDRLLPQEKNRLAKGAAFPNRYLKRIKYANTTPFQKSGWHFQVVFDYGEHDADNPEAESEVNAWACRPDPFSNYRAGFEIRTYRLCRRVLMFHHFPQELGNALYLVRSTDFDYEESPVACYLSSITQTGYARESDAESYRKKSFPPLELAYTQMALNQEVHVIDGESLENLPAGLDDARYHWVDLDGEGISGILSEQAGAWFYKRNLGGAQFGPMQVVGSRPSPSNLAAGLQRFMDLAGDGQLDLVQLRGSLPGYYERDEGVWRTFTAFESCPNIDWNDPNLRLVELTGDGHADVMISGGEAFFWYPSLAEEGFGAAHIARKAHDEERGPAIVFSDATQSIFLADMSGDGLTDIVRIRNGEACYWPNMGYGCFGAKVTMAGAPHFDHPDQFNAGRIRMADIDGSGTNDIIYLGRDAITIWFNRAGNSWSEPHRLTGLPVVDNLSAVSVIDLMGNGTACIVWSSPSPAANGQPLRYVDLTSGIKPHLLKSMKNNLGAETRLYYSSSTKFYLQDAAAGRPWITKLPFPVHVVERVETYDWISKNRFVTRYAYHHGYYDGEEREFRGFGMVEQWDTEEFAALTASGEFPAGINIDAASHVPPVLTKTWFHTGAYAGSDKISTFFANSDYYREPLTSDAQFQASLLPDTLLPAGITKPDGSLLAATLSARERREACRALKGNILRQEIYALDGSPESVHPYSVSERNYEIKWLQPERDGQYAVFFTHARETVDYYYERNPADPRVTHQAIVSVNAFGNVLKSVGVAYGRRQPDASLSSQDQAKQAQPLITYAENLFTAGVNLAHSYRAPLSCETRTYEITGLELIGKPRFSFADLAGVVAAVEIPYEVEPGSSLQKRLIEHVRTLYRKDDLSEALPLGQADPLALRYETYNLAFTPGLLAEVYGDRVDEALLKDECRYIKSADYKAQGLFPQEDQDDLWWKPSGRAVYSPDAPDHFYLPGGFADPFGKLYTVTYDDYDLLMEQTSDPLGNSVSAQNNYRTMLPWKVIDPNGNRSGVRFDELGMTVAMAVMGKPGQNEGDALDETSSEPSSSDDPTTRLEYDLFNWMINASPSYIRMLAREKHGPSNSRWQQSYIYSDGFGREVQTKAQAEPGLVGGAFVNERWVGTGWTIFNNKGEPVKKYEPFFSDTFEFEFAKQNGVSATLFYDPLGRVVATLHPNHTYEKIIFDPWRQEIWDVNDTLHPYQVYDPQAPNALPDHTFNPADDADVGEYFKRLADDEYLPTWYDLRMDAAKAAAQWPDTDPVTGDSLPQNVIVRASQKKAAQQAARHAATPSVAYLDALGRPFLTVVDNGLGDNGTPRKFHTRAELDIEGKQLSITDALGRTVMSTDYDITGSSIHYQSMEAGERWTLDDVTGQAVRRWDSLDHVMRITYDEARRPTHLFVSHAGGNEILAERTVYGEAHPNPAPLNLRGRVYRVYDGAGAVTNDQYDFKGNLLSTSRQLAADYTQQPDWSPIAMLASAQDIASAAQPLLEAETFTTSTQYDALNRPVSVIGPDDSESRPSYNEAGLLDGLDVRIRGAASWTTFVNNIDYDAKGQRELIEYGNGTSTSYTYERQTSRLIKATTTRAADNKRLQDLSYTYDPAGNITEILDDAQQTIYFNNAVVEPHASYAYDALYRLIEATGREHIGQNASPQVDEDNSPRMNQPHPNDGQAMRNYKESYIYDAAGNILKLIHQAGPTGSWTRRYEYEAANNRLRSASLPSDPDGAPLPVRYEYDPHGSMLKMPHLADLKWDFKGQLREVALGGGGTAYYSYSATGSRTRKVVKKSGLTEVRIYIGNYEVFRRFNSGGLLLERETLNVTDGSRRIAQVDTKTVDSGTPVASPSPLVRHHLGNHLGSAALEVDASGQVISYEEYYPYGSTSYHSVVSGAEVSLKRYRYAGKERDDETGLDYCGARYYAAWLGRWISCDPGGLIDGLNLYARTRNNPITFTDPTGMEGKPWFRADAYETGDDNHSSVLLTNMEGEWMESIAFADDQIVAKPPTPQKAAPKPPPPKVEPPKEPEPEPEPEPEVAEEEGSWRDNEIVQFLGGAAMGGIQGWIPFGFVGNLVPLDTPEAQLGRAVGEAAMGVAQMIVGTIGAGGGGLLMVTGIGTIPGVAVEVASAAVFVQGATNVVGGFQALSTYLQKSNSSSGGGSSASSGGSVKRTVAEANKISRQNKQKVASTKDGQALIKRYEAEKLNMDPERFVDFSDHLYNKGPNDVNIGVLRGSRQLDFDAANEIAGYTQTPAGYTWHHHQDLGRMQLVKSSVHSGPGLYHSGGVSIWKKIFGLSTY